jgi:hypothetical protein
MPRAFLSAKTLIAAPVLTLSLLGGCGYMADGNPLSSREEFNYRSTSTMPQTVVLRDLRTDEVLYTWEVPVNKKLYVRFLTNKAQPMTESNPDQCEWLIYSIDRWNPPLENRLRFNVPPNNSRRLDLYERPSPELPGDMKPSDVPQPPADLPPIK